MSDHLGPIGDGLPPRLRRDLADGTASTEAEVDTFLASVRLPARRSSPVAPLALGLALAALALLALRPPAPPVERAAVATAMLAEGVAVHRFGELTVVEEGAEWLVLQLADGAVELAVSRPVAVLAAEVRVEMRSGRLQLVRAGDRVEVRVADGAALVRSGDQVHLLGAGDRWSTPAAVLAVAPPAAPEVEAPPPVAEPTVAPDPAPMTVPAPVTPEGPDAAALLTRLLDGVGDGASTAALQAIETELRAAFPDAPETQEAITRLAEVRATRLPPSEAVRLLAEVRAAHPTLPRRLDLLELQARLAKDGLHDCGLALPAYRELAASAVGRQRAEAQVWRGICAHHQGFVPEAVQALQSAQGGPLSPELAALVDQSLERIALLEED